MTRAFARLWLASLFSEIAEWMLQIALPVHIYQATGSAGSTSVTMAAGVLPIVLLSPLAGFVADRWDRRRTLWLVCLGQAVSVVPLLLPGPPIWLVFTVMVAQSSAATLFEPARTALLPQLVDRDRIVAANGLTGFNASAARLVGSSLGGIVLATGGLSAVLLVYLAAMAIAAAFLVRRFDVVNGQAVAREPIVRAWLDGLREFWRARRLRLVGLMLVVSSFAQGMFLVLFVLFVTGPLAHGEAAVGLLRGVQAIGGLVAGLVIASVARRMAPESMCAFGGIGIGLLLFAVWNMPALTTGLTVYFVLFGVAGAPSVFVMSGTFTILQTVGGPERSGRIVATSIALMAACQVVGMLVAGPLADAWSLTALLDLQAAAMVTSGLTALVSRWYARRDERRRQATTSATTTEQAFLDL